MPHTPVLLKETIEILNPQPGEFFIDGTLGSGGHAMAILEKIGPKGKLLGIDWDASAIERLKSKFKNQNSKLILVQGNYADLPEILKRHGLPKADGLLLDLGFSSESLTSSRGFTFLRNDPLDMRYNSESKSPTAAEIINTFNEKDLADIFWKYGEERFSRQVAKKIIEERKKKLIKTTFDLVEIVKKVIPFPRGRLHPTTKVFQALRIYVNQELENLEKLLKNLEKIIKPSSEISAGPPKADKNVICRNSTTGKPSSENSIGSLKANKIDEYRVSTTGKGRVAIISYHSLEDRLVKNYFREFKNQGKAEILTRKPIRPSREEIINNPRSRSAKLRAITLT